MQDGITESENIGIAELTDFLFFVPYPNFQANSGCC